MNKPIGQFNFFELSNLICNHISQTSTGYQFGDESENFLFRDLFTADYSRSLTREFFDQVLNQLIQDGYIIKTKTGLNAKRFIFGTWQMRREPGAFTHQDYIKIFCGDNPIGDVGAGSPYNPNQMVANARLITAAPELLEACENLIFGFRETDADGRSTYTISRLEALQLLAAVAKARGNESDELECRNEIESKFQNGEIAKHKDWTWGGRITAFNKTTGTVYILVGNDETGETYPVPQADCQIFDKKTSQYLPSESDLAQVS